MGFTTPDMDAWTMREKGFISMIEAVNLALVFPYLPWSEFLYGTLGNVVGCRVQGSSAKATNQHYPYV